MKDIAMNDPQTRKRLFRDPVYLREIADRHGVDFAFKRAAAAEGVDVSGLSQETRERAINAFRQDIGLGGEIHG